MKCEASRSPSAGDNAFLDLMGVVAVTRRRFVAVQVSVFSLSILYKYILYILDRVLTKIDFFLFGFGLPLCGDLLKVCDIPGFK